MRIKKLSAELASQIAAGEVIERPASVIKEILENALDAGSSEIHITIEAGGTRLMRVRDNGVGIHVDDLALALSSHATSKITKIDDFNHLTSLGFRGEALASISAVAELTLMSRARGATTAYSARAEGRDQAVTILPIAHPEGTTVEVRNLFFNVPVRRKFLRRATTEFAHIEEMVKRLVLSRMDVGFILEHNQKTLLRVKPCFDDVAREQRIQKILGQGFLQHALVIDMTFDHIRLQGWLGLPSHTRSQSDNQYFFINGRSVRDKVINHAIRQAYGDALPLGRYAQYVLYLSLPATAFDVNVHPGKWEVRFSDARLIHDLIIRTIQQALNGEITASVYSLNNQTLSTTIKETPEKNDITEVYQTVAKTPLNQIKQAQKKYNNVDPSPIYWNIPSSITPTITAIDTAETLCDPSEKSTRFGEARGLVLQKYLLAETTQGIVIINLCAGLKAIAAAAWREMCAYGNIHIKNLLQPLRIPFTTALTTSAETRFTHACHVLGFETDFVNANQLLLRALPTALLNGDVTPLLQHILNLCSGKTEIIWVQEIPALIKFWQPELSNVTTQDKQGQFLKNLEKISDFNAWQLLLTEQLP